MWIIIRSLIIVIHDNRHITDQATNYIHLDHQPCIWIIRYQITPLIRPHFGWSGHKLWIATCYLHQLLLITNLRLIIVGKEYLLVVKTQQLKSSITTEMINCYPYCWHGIMTFINFLYCRVRLIYLAQWCGIYTKVRMMSARKKFDQAVKSYTYNKSTLTNRKYMENKLSLRLSLATQLVFTPEVLNSRLVE
jgi:hypothetical protein